MLTGKVYIPFRIGATYYITISYKGIKKSATLKYNEEVVLFILINPTEPDIVNIEFATPLPLSE